jgi:SAM-dependent methyltransferase
VAIEALYLRILKRAIDQRRAARPAMQGLLLGYPDLVVPRAALAPIVGEDVVAGLAPVADGARHWAYHGFPAMTEPMYDSLGLLRSLGVDPVVVDAAVLRGMERVVDLNEPLPADLARRFDVVVDTGTCEHCFNVAQAFCNACEALAAGGFLVHAAPMSRVNHGFWCFSPTIYPDFFEENGFRIHFLAGIAGNIRDGMQAFEIDPFARLSPPPECALYVVAERAEVKPFRWPVQRKYRGMLAS